MWYIQSVTVPCHSISLLHPTWKLQPFLVLPPLSLLTCSMLTFYVKWGDDPLQLLATDNNGY